VRLGQCVCRTHRTGFGQCSNGARAGDLEAIPDARWDVYALGALALSHALRQAPDWTPSCERAIRAAPTLEEKAGVYREGIRAVAYDRTAHASGVDRRWRKLSIDVCRPIPSGDSPNAQLLSITPRAQRPFASPAAR